MALIEFIPRVHRVGCIYCVIGIYIGYPVAKWLGARMAEILSCLPQEKFSEPLPALRISASKAVRGNLGSSVVNYEALLIIHPNNHEIAMRELHCDPAVYHPL